MHIAIARYPRMTSSALPLGVLKLRRTKSNPEMFEMASESRLSTCATFETVRKRLTSRQTVASEPGMENWFNVHILDF